MAINILYLSSEALTYLLVTAFYRIIS